ncbi:hypothetical protein [Deinococcus reticulitermitis]|uniref:hypothetical protein n=1 Tax=Deinococcus reticulitermitis TaxID=856736 RepID=UPI0015A6C479|nr:hypothetical protein [Deinococcus reticulitermitis]
MRLLRTVGRWLGVALLLGAAFVVFRWGEAQGFWLGERPAPAANDPYADLQSGPSETAELPDPAPSPALSPRPPLQEAPPTPTAPPLDTAYRVPPPQASAAATEVRFSGPLPASADGWYELGTRAREAGDARKAARAFTQAAALNPSAANWRALADEQVRLGDYAAATRAYDQAAARYRQRGDDVTARALEYLAAPYRQELEVLRIVPQAGPTQPRLARLEPPRGVLLGIHVSAAGVVGAWGQPPRMTEALRPFAVAFRYWKFSASREPALVFPGRFARAARASGQALHLALEPGMPLGDISDEIVRRFGEAARASGVPVFVRFASEMNDPQNAWSRDPALYRRTFARVARILHQEASNVALVWMPMPGDLARIAEYYPGPGAVDWAGLSLYSVPFENGDPARPRLNAHPLTLIDGFYRQYAPRHPVQLSEYASSHRSGAAPGQDFSAFAARQLREVYWGAWLKYPRLKNINWLDLDMHAGDHNGKARERRNDYRLLGVPAKWEAFRAVQESGAFFRSFQQSRCLTCEVPTARPWGARVEAERSLSGALWLVTARPLGGVKLVLDGREIPVEQTLPHRFTLPPLAPGRYELRVLAWDEESRALLDERRPWRVGAGEPGQ